MADTKKLTVREQLEQMFGKRDVAYAIAEAQGKAPCICGKKGADRCTQHPKEKP